MASDAVEPEVHAEYTMHAPRRAVVSCLCGVVAEVNFDHDHGLLLTEEIEIKDALMRAGCVVPW